jgi:hypothetical protein
MRRGRSRQKDGAATGCPGARHALSRYEGFLEAVRPPGYFGAAGADYRRGGNASKPGAGADRMRRGGVGSVGTRGRVIDRDQLRKLD